MKKIFKLVFFLNVVLNCYSQSNNPLNQLTSEDDWSLPSYTQRSPNSGLYYVFQVPDAYNAHVTWRTLNPAEDVYDWSGLDAVIALNVPIFIRIYASNTQHCPLWVPIKYPNIPVLHWGAPNEMYDDLLGPTLGVVNNPGNFYAMWHTGFTTEFKKFLLALKSKNYLANPNVKFMYAPGAWRWNEWDLGKMLTEIKLKAPITPTNFVNWFKNHLDDYVDASNGHPEKLVFTGYGKIENPANYSSDADWFLALNDITNGDNKLTSYAVSQGMGVREGAQEFFNDASEQYSWGAPSQTINNINYQYIVENHPLHSNQNRIIATENELFCSNGPEGIANCSYYHNKMATLKALQLRVNWLNITDAIYDINPSLFQYARLTMNKRVTDSPDAWASLRQSYQPLFTNTPPALPNPVYNSSVWTDRVTLPYRNWEKWLFQREVQPNGNTVPVYKLNNTTPNFFDYYNFEAFEGLRTDKINGSNYIYFNADDNFINGGTNNIQIKITYLDNFAGNWWVEYDSSGTQITKQSNPIINSNDNSWKTVTINVPDAGFTNRQNQGMDFRIYNGGTNDITVRFTRIIKLQNPSLTTSEFNKNKKIIIYPNPVSTILNVDSEDEIKTIEIKDILGQIVFTSQNQNKKVDCSSLQNGIYFISITTKKDNTISTFKLLKS